MLRNEALLLLITSLSSTGSTKYLSTFVAMRTQVTEEDAGVACKLPSPWASGIRSGPSGYGIDGQLVILLRNWEFQRC